MARPKKVEVPVSLPLPPREKEATRDGATLVMEVDSFVRIRDSVVTSLATLQDAIQTISSAYIKHTNTVLGEHGAGLDVESALSRLGDNPLLGAFGGLRAVSLTRSPAADAKKEKKKRVHDPNAPKRPLTPYFLYMQTARPIIAEDLGPEVPKGAVSTEGVRRWNAMAAHDKKLWNDAYADNLKLYNARMHSYKSGHIGAKDMSDEEALAYAESHSIGAGLSEPTADGQLVAEAMLDAPADIDEDMPEPPPPVELTPRTPKGKPTRKGRQAPVEHDSIVPPVSSAIIPPGSARSMAAPLAMAGDPNLDKKRKRSKKGGVADEPVASIEREDAAAPFEKKQRKKKSQI
ncbi:MAG: hypothetical protein M1818_002816 [Claussenomyces sp. TS43310]|nr:MAG: hypothetical protein M1818_002816 [Claussenomyces sp. TS43310]